MMKRTPLYSCFLSTLCFIIIFSFGAGAQDIQATLSTYSNKFGHEKAYLHYDKAAYAPGETVWFKAYLMEGLLPAESSKTFYVDWLDEKGDLLLHSVCPVVDASTSGQFSIPEKYTGRALQVKAYTKWMLNFDTAFIYSKSLRVINKSATTGAKPAIVPKLQFFPEGGDMVAGVQNKIAFKADDQWGMPVTVKGYIQSSNGTKLDSLKTVHNGMGSFMLQPQPGISYVAKWKDAKGTEHTTELPAAKSAGIALQLNAAGTKRYFNIYLNAEAVEPMKKLHLVGTMFQQMVFKTAVDLTATTEKKGVIPTENLPTGILTITVFDAAWNAVAERITYVNNEDYHFKPQMEVAHWGLNKRARNEIQITLPDSLMANLSVSVTDAAIGSDSSQNIISALLLTSDIKGYVHNPAYYFSASGGGVQQHLDLVMLTHGWRRFKWDDVVKGKLPVLTFPRDTAYLSLSGKVYGIPPSQMGAGASIVTILKERDTASRMLVTPIDASGRFKEPEAIFFDTLSVYYQLQPAKTMKNGEVRFLEDRLTAPNYKAAKYQFVFNPYLDTTGHYRQVLLAVERARAEALMQEKTLANVTVKARTKTPAQLMNEKYASGLFRGGDGYDFDLVNDNTSFAHISIFNYLQGKVAGLQISTGGGSASLQWRGGTPQLYLDEMPVDVDLISSIPVSDVAYIRVLRPPFMGAGGGGGSGAIAIYTRKGGDVQQTPGKGLNTNTIAGYTPIREFYSPNYASFNQRNEQEDLRTTLYWAPMLLNAPGKKVVTFSFYNNDVSKAFRVIIEGMTRDGRLAHIEEMME